MIFITYDSKSSQLITQHIFLHIKKLLLNYFSTFLRPVWQNVGALIFIKFLQTGDLLQPLTSTAQNLVIFQNHD